MCLGSSDVWYTSGFVVSCSIVHIDAESTVFLFGVCFAVMGIIVFIIQQHRAKGWKYIVASDWLTFRTVLRNYPRDFAL
jgi:hypothetical protein